jgi:hypothetical protein
MNKNFKQLWQHKITSTQNCPVAFFFQCEFISFQKWFLTVFFASPFLWWIFLNCFIIHVCIQGLGHFFPLPPPPPLPPTLPLTNVSKLAITTLLANTDWCYLAWFYYNPVSEIIHIKYIGAQTENTFSPCWNCTQGLTQAKNCYTIELHASLMKVFLKCRC